MTDHPDTLASAARELCRAVKRCAPDGCCHSQEHLGDAQRRLLAALAAHDQQDPPSLETEVEETVRGMSFSYATTRAFFDFLIARGWTPPSPDASNTPEPPATYEQIREEWGEEMADLAEGGQPDTDDELLARADGSLTPLLAASNSPGGVGYINKLAAKRAAELILNLASALRRKRDEANYTERYARLRLDVERLERELAEANDALSDARRTATAHRESARISHNTVMDLERRLAEARSHGEVLWTGTVGELKSARGDIQIQHHTQHVKSTDRVVVRATADQEEIE